MEFPLLTLMILTAVGWLWWRHRQRHTRLLETVELVTIEAFASGYLQNGRPLTILLPPHYHTSNQTYKTLYVNDGQELAALKLRETVATLIARKRIEPIVVVAIPANEARMQEYGTAVAANAQGMGADAAAYVRFVTEEVVPAIRYHFRVREGAADTAVLGASLGGLSAFDLAWNRPDIFGIVGVMSGSFWWRAAAESKEVTAAEPGQRIAHAMVRWGEKRDGLRFWFEAATQDEVSDRDQNGVIDAIQDTLELMEELAELGYERGRDMVYVEMRGGRHDYDTWSRVLPNFLEWAFGRR
jgi:enterochelin esterase-like enzyme